MYASHALSLAALEYLVHIDPEDAPTDLVGLGIDVPDDLDLETWPEATLPPDWRAVTAPTACRTKGEVWAKAKSALGVWVPSVLIPGERNLMLNPSHPAIDGVRTVTQQDFTFDPRLLYRIPPLGA